MSYEPFLRIPGAECPKSWMHDQPHPGSTLTFLLAQGHMVKSRSHPVGTLGSFMLPPDQADSPSNHSSFEVGVRTRLGFKFSSPHPPKELGLGLGLGLSWGSCSPLPGPKERKLFVSSPFLCLITQFFFLCRSVSPLISPPPHAIFVALCRTWSFSVMSNSCWLSP